MLAIMTGLGCSCDSAANTICRHSMHLSVGENGESKAENLTLKLVHDTDSLINVH